MPREACHIPRRVGDDAFCSLLITDKLLGTHEWHVIHLSNCGMEFFSEAGWLMIG